MLRRPGQVHGGGADDHRAGAAAVEDRGDRRRLVRREARHPRGERSVRRHAAFRRAPAVPFALGGRARHPRASASEHEERRAAGPVRGKRRLEAVARVPRIEVGRAVVALRRVHRAPEHHDGVRRRQPLHGGRRVLPLQRPRRPPRGERGARQVQEERAVDRQRDRRPRLPRRPPAPPRPQAPREPDRQPCEQQARRHEEHRPPPRRDEVHGWTSPIAFESCVSSRINRVLTNSFAWPAARSSSTPAATSARA